MNGDADERVQPGACPLCLGAVPRPRATAGVIPILADHFATDCQVTDFTRRTPWRQATV